jgi:hypothetical protein
MPRAFSRTPFDSKCCVRTPGVLGGRCQSRRLMAGAGSRSAIEAGLAPADVAQAMTAYMCLPPVHFRRRRSRSVLHGEFAAGQSARPIGAASRKLASEPRLIGAAPAWRRREISATRASTHRR